MLANLRALFSVLVDIALMRRGPEHIPASTALLGMVVALNLIVSALLSSVLPNTPSTWPLQMLTDMLVMMLWYHTGLSLANKRERAVQTLIATLGVTALFLPVLMPLTAQLQPYLADPENATPPPAIVQIPAVIFGVWLFVTLVRIVRAAFEWSWFPSILFVFAQNLASAYLLAMIFGAGKAG